MPKPKSNTPSATCIALCAYVSNNYAGGATITPKATVAGIPLVPGLIFNDINNYFQIPAGKKYAAADIKTSWTMQAFADDIDKRGGKAPAVKLKPLKKPEK